MGKIKMSSLMFKEECVQRADIWQPYCQTGSYVTCNCTGYNLYSIHVQPFWTSTAPITSNSVMKEKGAVGGGGQFVENTDLQQNLQNSKTKLHDKQPEQIYNLKLNF